jgi:TolB-like protein
MNFARHFMSATPRLQRHGGRRRSARRLWACIVAALSVLGATAELRSQDLRTLALLPFENVSGSGGSVRIIMPLIEQTVTAKGYQIITSERIEPFLARHRIRNTGMLSRIQLQALRREFGVDLVLIGSVDLFYESADNPQCGLSSRIVSTAEGKVFWAESTGRTGGDYTRILGLGTITSGSELAREVVKILFQSLPRSGAPFAPPQEQKLTTFRFFGPRGNYRSPALDNRSQWRAAVTVFENASERRGAGRILADVFTSAVFHHGRFEVIDPGEVNEALIAFGRTPYGGMDISTLRDFKKRTGIDAIFKGTVYRYNEGLKREATTSPEIVLDITLLDAETGKTLWFATGERSGDDSQIALDFGVIRSMIPLIRKTVAEMLNSL